MFCLVITTSICNIIFIIIIVIIGNLCEGYVHMFWNCQ